MIAPTDENINQMTAKLFDVVLGFLETENKPDARGVVPVEVEMSHMMAVLNAIGNVTAGLLSSLPDHHEKIPWYIKNLLDTVNVATDKQSPPGTIKLN